MQKKYALVTDFDGTVTFTDIGNALAIHNGTATVESIENDYVTNKDQGEWMRENFGSMKKTKQEFEELVMKHGKIRPGFKEAVLYAKQNNLPVEIVSGGLDLYINPVLNSCGLEDIAVYSVRGVFTENGILVDFPHFGGMTLHDFKASRVNFYKKAGYEVIFFGDGVSDYSAAAQADIVFATDHLRELCKANKVKYYDLNDYNEALEILRRQNVSVS